MNKFDSANYRHKWSNTMTKLFAKLRKSEKGATAIEYGLIAALVAVAAITGMTALGTALDNQFSGVAGNLTAGGGGGEEAAEE